MAKGFPSYGSYKAAGWDRITDVEPQVWRDEYNRIEFALVWIVCGKTVYAVDHLRGETLDDIVAHYQKRGWTDDRCYLFSVDGERV